MVYEFEDLMHAETYVDGEWVISKPLVGNFWCRLKDAIGVLFGKFVAVKFYKQD